MEKMAGIAAEGMKSHGIAGKVITSGNGWSAAPEVEAVLRGGACVQEDILRGAIVSHCATAAPALRTLLAATSRGVGGEQGARRDMRHDIESHSRQVPRWVTT